MKLQHLTVIRQGILSPPARGRGLKLVANLLKHQANGRPPHGGVD